MEREPDTDSGSTYSLARGSVINDLESDSESEKASSSTRDRSIYIWGVLLRSIPSPASPSIRFLHHPAMAAASRRAKARARRDIAVADHPCEQELITSFLTPRLVSGQSPCEFIHDADVYAAHPADLTREHAAAVASNGEEAWYFFTALRGKTGGRKARTVDSGEGCWHSEAGSKPVVAARLGRVGHRQSFSFVTKEDGQRVRSGWLMVELGLDDDDDGHDELTVCKVYFSQRAAKNKKPAAATPSPSASGRKRKAADENDDASTQARRVRSLTPEADSEAAVDDDAVEEDETPAGGGPDELHAKNPAPGDEPEVEDPASFSCWLQNECSMMALLGMDSPAVDEDENPANFSLWPQNENSMMALMRMNSPEPVDDLDEDDPASYAWWLRQGSGMMAALTGKNNSAADSEQSSTAEVAVVEGLPEIRSEAPAALPERAPATGPPVARDKDQPVYMWLTYDELYDLPEVKEFLKLDLQQLLQPVPLPPSVPVETDTKPDLQLQTLSLPPPAPGEAEIKPDLQPADG